MEENNQKEPYPGEGANTDRAEETAWQPEGNKEAVSRPDSSSDGADICGQPYSQGAGSQQQFSQNTGGYDQNAGVWNTGGGAQQPNQNAGAWNADGTIQQPSWDNGGYNQNAGSYQQPYSQGQTTYQQPNGEGLGNYGQIYGNDPGNGQPDGNNADNYGQAYGQYSGNGQPYSGAQNGGYQQYNGNPSGQWGQYSQYQKTPGNPGRNYNNGFGIASLILGILSFVLFCTCINIPIAIVAIVFGILHLGKTSDGKAIGIVGIVTGALSILAFIVTLVLMWAPFQMFYEERVQNLPYSSDYNNRYDYDDRYDFDYDDLEDLFDLPFWNDSGYGRNGRESY